MNRGTRILEHNKADAMKIVSRKPSDTEGIEGDISVGSTANGVSLFAKIGNKWYEFSSNESFGDSTPRVQGSISYLIGGFADSGTSNFLPVGRHFYETGSMSSGSSDYSNALLLPYDCRVLNLSVRATTALGASTAAIWTAVDGANINSGDTSYRAETSSSVNCSEANKGYNFAFSGGYKIPAKSVLAIQLNTANSQTKVSFVLTLDYDIPV